MNSPTPEHQRLKEDSNGDKNWKQWGPYLSERQWGTVREDYSSDGDAWNYFPHDMARMRAYRWGEDGIAGISDDQQKMCLSLALWNGRDPFLKERLFGLTNVQGNHGEDVKELYYYLDATPTHSYLKMLYKYPQAEFPYQQLLDKNAARGKHDREFELIDTGLFDENRYFDVFVEYARPEPEEILMRVTVHNRGDTAETIHLLPLLWFRNTWSWGNDDERPVLSAVGDNEIHSAHSDLGQWKLQADGKPSLLFSENDSNQSRIYDQPEKKGYFKDAFHDYIVDDIHEAVNSAKTGTRAAVHYTINIPAGESREIRLRLSKDFTFNKEWSFRSFNKAFKQCLDEANIFYKHLQKGLQDEDARNVQRQAFAGMIWSKQFYNYDVHQWLKGDPGYPPPPEKRKTGRNSDWDHIYNANIISMPDTWEYPWYAAWDLAFHSVVFAKIDTIFAKAQLVKLTHDWYMNPDGELPAYEWNFGDVNPPVHAWATLRVFQMDREQRGDKGDMFFLERVFLKLILNFTWWVNQKDIDGNNIFQGGFLGLDNIGVFDRSKPLPGGGYLNQADGTAWMAMYCLNMMHIALELTIAHDRAYEDMATKFFEHFLYVAKAIEKGASDTGLWDEKDGFYYDVLSTANGSRKAVKINSMVGLIPLFAVEVLNSIYTEQLPNFAARTKWFLDHRPDLANLVSRWEEPGKGKTALLSLLRGSRIKRILAKMLDETQFLSDYGVRSLSREYLETPYVFDLEGQHNSVDYEPAESQSDMFGGNSNWRGPVWLPINFLIIESLHKFHQYYGDDFRIEYPVGSGRTISLEEVADELSSRLSNLFLRDSDGRRAIFGAYEKFQTDPHFRDYLPFNEFFNGDTGEGLGASHQTGWTGLIAILLHYKSYKHQTRVRKNPNK
ncbi:MAG: hypothetical protein J7L04_10625 [Bacteroidales bacterium]|nr:hypothetical protein [Bacteroidales bacterium]